MRITQTALLLTLATAAALPDMAAAAEVRVQDLARLQGQRTNRLMGFGLVVGLRGTGDGDKNAATMRALMALHKRYHAPTLDTLDLRGNGSVALVAVEAEIPEHGGREGETVQVTVTSIGTAKSLEGGQLLTTPLQYAMFRADDPATQRVFALAAGRVELSGKLHATRGIVRRGATLEVDLLYTFIQEGTITLVLNETHADWAWSAMVARALNHELGDPETGQAMERDAEGNLVAAEDLAVAIGPKNVVVRIPSYELANPAPFVSRVLQTPLFALPAQRARVVINRTTKNLSFTGNATVSPTVLQVPGFGTLMIGRGAGEAGAPASQPADAGEPVQLQSLLDTLSRIKATPEQMIDAIEHLHRTGSLHAHLSYEE